MVQRKYYIENINAIKNVLGFQKTFSGLNNINRKGYMVDLTFYQSLNSFKKNLFELIYTNLKIACTILHI